MITMSKEFKLVTTTLKSSLNETLTHDLLIVIKTSTTKTLKIQNFIYVNTSEKMCAPAIETEHKVAYQRQSVST